MMRALYTLRVRPTTDEERANLRAVVEEQASDVLDYLYGEVSS